VEKQVLQVVNFWTPSLDFFDHLVLLFAWLIRMPHAV
jgi:hypothetical protein